MPTDKRCPNCGAGLDYLPKAGVYYCRYCKTEFNDPDAEEKKPVQVIYEIHQHGPEQAPDRNSPETVPQKKPKGLKHILLICLCATWIMACIGAYRDEPTVENFFTFLLFAVPAIWGIWKIVWGDSHRRSRRK